MLLVALLVAGCAPPEPEGAAADALDALAVKGRAPKTGYDREGRFGPAWADVDRNGCDTRNDVLFRDLTDVVLRDDCEVLSGVLADRYSGRTIRFYRDNAPNAPDVDGDGVPGHSSGVQVDHIVPLSEAWQKGAQQLDQETRVRLANDPLNLMASEGRLNSQKGDSDAASWLPPNRGFRCEYVARQVAVKKRYGLWVTRPERDAIASVLASCPGEPLPTGGLVSAPAPQQSSDPGELTGPLKPSPPSSPPAEEPPASSVPSPPPGTSGPERFPTCAAARAAGEGPYTRSDPEYSWYRDPDGDGVVCE